MVSLDQTFTTAAQPQADFWVSSVGSSEGFIVVFFTNMSSGGVSPLTCAWDFDNDGIVDSTQWQDWHCYRVSGTYTVSLTVTDASGDTDSEVKVNCFSILSSNGATVETADGQISTEFPTGAVPGAAMVDHRNKDCFWPPRRARSIHDRGYLLRHIGAG